MKLTHLTTVVCISLTCTPVFAQSSTTSWTSDVVENYLNENKGSSINALTDLENNSRWYATIRAKSESNFYDGDHNGYLQANLRLRGSTEITDGLNFIGDFWMKAQENYSNTGKGNAQDGGDFNGFNDVNKWEQYRFGFENDALGALMFGRHSTTWTIFALDMGSQGILDSQGDFSKGDGKADNKVLYKSHFNNNLFVSASRDLDNEVYGLDIGYQTSDIYSYAPGSFGLYASVHNGAPAMKDGTKNLMGNMKSNMQFVGADEATPTYALAGFKQWGFDYRMVGQVAYSEMDEDETVDTIRARGGLTEGGLGYSTSLGIQKLPENMNGLSYILYGSSDEFGTSISPELRYIMTGKKVGMLQLWGTYTVHNDDENLATIGVQWDI